MAFADVTSVGKSESLASGPHAMMPEAFESASHVSSVGKSVLYSVMWKPFADETFADVAFAEVVVADVAVADVAFAEVAFAEVVVADVAFADVAFADVPFVEAEVTSVGTSESVLSLMVLLLV